MNILREYKALLMTMEHHQCDIKAGLSLRLKEAYGPSDRKTTLIIYSHWYKDLGFNRFGEPIPNYFYWIYEHHVGLLYQINLKAELRPLLLAGQINWVKSKIRYYQEKENERFDTSNKGLQRKDSEATNATKTGTSVQ